MPANMIGRIRNIRDRAIVPASDAENVIRIGSNHPVAAFALPIGTKAISFVRRSECCPIGTARFHSAEQALIRKIAKLMPTAVTFGMLE